MGPNIFRNLTAVIPGNFLGNNRNLHLHQSEPPHDPPAKRQKVQDSSTHTEAHFAPFSIDETTDRSISRKRSRDSISDSQETSLSQPANTQGHQYMPNQVSEFRELDKYVSPSQKKRVRLNPHKNNMGGHRKSQTFDGISLISSDGEDSDGEVEVVKSPETDVAPLGNQADEHQQSIGIIGDRFRTPGNIRRSLAAHKVNIVIDATAKRKSTGSSPDELAPKAQDMKENSRTKRPGTPSPSVSKRGNIPSTKFRSPDDHELVLAKAAINGKLRISRAVSGDFKYEASKATTEEECFLEVGSISTLLTPTNLKGETTQQYSYCLVNLQKVGRISFSQNPACCIVSIFRAADAINSCPAKLVIEFKCREDLEKFVSWAKLYKANEKKSPTKPHIIDTDEQDDLEKKLLNLFGEAKRNTTLRDTQEDDVRQIEHNRAAKTKSTPLSQGPISHVKKKDSMKLPVSTFPWSPKDMVEPDEPQRHNPPRQARTTRSSFALIDSSESSRHSEAPEPNGWSIQNKGWEKQWRNSLVFPPRGKSRATVDKEDISRLDEGEFLNDNLITFYLRYLQHTLEAERPDLAQKIYFHNTYFYEKLKSPKTSGGINYDSVKAWTSKVDLFTKDFIIVPINEFSHWYVAIIYNAPKLLPSPDQKEVLDGQSANTITVEGDEADSEKVSRASSQSRKLDETRSAGAIASTADSDVINHLSPTDQESQKAEIQVVTSEPDVEEIIDKSDSRADLEQIQPSSSNHRGRRAGKRPSVGPRKFNPDHPRIITLDSLALQHSPASRILKQYLVAELKDKKGLENPIPTALGMTARKLPEQTNHCDCGVFLLGYIKEFLEDPYKFVHSVLQYETINWNLKSPDLRNDIRDLIFKLQKEQQDHEDAHKEEKRKAASLKRKHQESEEQATSRSVSAAPAESNVAKEDDNEATPRKKSPTPKSSRPEPRAVSDFAESQRIPGLFPASPTVVRAGTRNLPAAADTDQIEQNEIVIVASPRSVTASGSSPIRPVVVNSSEVARAQDMEPIHSHGSPKQTRLGTEVVKLSPQRVEPQSNESRMVSRYFAGREDGDIMASARLHEQPGPTGIIDVSD
ncbi:cysteine proteinase [Hypoxylon sp. FL1150]|nr:cysteine proteinase [Hypoxylon sp. FL1150]